VLRVRQNGYQINKNDEFQAKQDQQTAGIERKPHT
jgi:hypothetical protein